MRHHTLIQTLLTAGLCTSLLFPCTAVSRDRAQFSASTSGASFFQNPAHEEGDVIVTTNGPNRFSSIRGELHLDFGWYSAAGVGGRIEFPVAPAGIPIVGLDNEIALSFGAELFYFYNPGFSGLGVYPIAAAQWNLFLGPNFSLFPELGVAFLFGPYREQYWGTFVGPYLGLGLRYHFNDRNALLARASWPAGLQLGLTF